MAECSIFPAELVADVVNIVCVVYCARHRVSRNLLPHIAEFYRTRACLFFDWCGTDGVSCCQREWVGGSGEVHNERTNFGCDGCDVRIDHIMHGQVLKCDVFTCARDARLTASCLPWTHTRRL